MTNTKQVGKATIENSGLPTKTTKGRKHQKCKRGWLHTLNTVFIFLYLLEFMSTEQRSYLSPAIAIGALGWNTLISKNAPCRLPQRPLAWISALASSLRLADAGTRASPVSGCKGGSTTKSRHTSWSQLAVKFLSSLWWMKVNPPWWQIIAWSTLNEASQTQCTWLGTLLIPTHTS